MAQKIIIDTDPGIDDSMAIFLAGLDPRLDLIGLTTIFGNVTTKIATRNALHLSVMMGGKIPVAQGAEKPLQITPNPPADFVHGAGGFGDIPVIAPPLKSAENAPAHEFIAKLARQAPGEIILCAIGPLTNLALLIDHDPEAAKMLKGVVIMGGSIKTKGNVSDFAEANIWNDPHAADKVFGFDWPMKLIGLDVTQPVVALPEDFMDIAQKSPIFGGFLNAVVQFYFKFHEETRGFRGCYMHDSTAVTAVTDPELFSFTPLPLIVETDGERIGQTRTDSGSGRPMVACALNVDANAVLNIFKKYTSQAMMGAMS